MKTNYFIVTLDFSKGSAYEHDAASKIPTVIKYGRMYDGKFQKGVIAGSVTNSVLHNTLYLLKRGYELSVVNESFQS